MRVVLVTGIFPPDIGGPATHAADLREELTARGHRVTVLSLSDAASPLRSPGIIRYPRAWPWPVRLGAVASWLIGNRRHYEVIYATGMHAAAVVGGRAARRPVVLKVVGDPAWERGRRLGLTAEGFNDFGSGREADPRLQAMRFLRDWSLRRATALTVPSPYLAAALERWLGGPVDATVVPNGVRLPSSLPRRSRTRKALRAIWVGRLVSHKRVDRIIEAVSRVGGVSLEVVGEGPERTRLEELARGLEVARRVTFRGDLPHDDVLRRMAAADVLLVASIYEGLPHVVIESMACGTPVVAGDVGGTADVVRDGENGVLLAEATPHAIAGALERLAADPELRGELSRGARREAAAWRFETTADRVVEALAAARDGAPGAVLIGKTRLPDRPGGALDRKLRILVRHLRTPTVMGVGPLGIRWTGRARVISFPSPGRSSAAAWFLSAAPLVAVVLTAGRRRTAVVCQSPYEAFVVEALALGLPPGLRPPVVVEVHGEWGAATRLYGRRGGGLRELADRAAGWSLRRADRVRVVSESLGARVRAAGYRGEIDRFPTFADFEEFLGPAPTAIPAEPRVAFVGALEPAKGVDVLLEAWAEVAAGIPYAHLSLVGEGRLARDLQRRAREAGPDGRVEFLGRVSPSEVRALLDRSSCLVLPSRSEGLPRVILEAMARGRPVVGTEVGGIPELVRHGVTGLLVPPEDPRALSRALATVLGDARRLRAMGRAARRAAVERDPVAEYESGIERLADWIAGR